MLSTVPLDKLTGLGAGMTLVSFQISFYYNLILAWSLLYLGLSFQKDLPFNSCNNTFNTHGERCTFHVIRCIFQTKLERFICILQCFNSTFFWLSSECVFNVIAREEAEQNMCHTFGTYLNLTTGSACNETLPNTTFHTVCDNFVEHFSANLTLGFVCNETFLDGQFHGVCSDHDIPTNLTLDSMCADLFQNETWSNSSLLSNGTLGHMEEIKAVEHDDHLILPEEEYFL